MINNDKIDKVAERISTMYVNGITDIVDSLLKTKKDLSNKEFGKALIGLNMKEIVKSKLGNIKTEYHNAHIEVLKDVKPPVDND